MSDYYNYLDIDEQNNWKLAIEEAKEYLDYTGYLDRDRWEEVVEEAHTILSNNATDEHNDYLHSNWWKELRKEILKRDNFRCRVCNIKATEVHHLSYYNKYNKDEKKDCISVCHDCHGNIHSGQPFKLTYLPPKQSTLIDFNINSD